MTPAEILARAEDRLRAQGRTGAQALDALIAAVRARLGDEVVADPVAAEAVAGLPLGRSDLDLLGLAYERFFADLFKGRRGQYFTPRPLVDLLVAVAEVGPGDVVVDPTCGSGGLLVQAGRAGATVHGIERDPYLAQLCALNLRLAGVAGDVQCGDAFRVPPRPCDLVLANPPFSVSIRDRAVLDAYDLGRGRARALSDHLFVELLERWVRPGGRAAVVLPWSVLVNPSASELRDRLARRWRRTAICSLPEGVFRPFGGAAGRACLLWLDALPPGRDAPPTRWAELVDPGYDVRSTRVRPTSRDAIDGLIAGEGWVELPADAWVPPPMRGRGRRVAELASLRSDRVAPAREPDRTVHVVELADADKTTGEIRQVHEVPGASVAGHKARLHPGDVLVSRMRPELGNVAIVPHDAPEPLVGSTEWLPLEPRGHGHALLHALRTPTFRTSLPVTEGQTRPRTTAEAVLHTTVPWPAPALVDRIDALSRALHQRRAALGKALGALQEAIDAHAAGRIADAQLAERLAALERDVD